MDSTTAHWVHCCTTTSDPSFLPFLPNWIYNNIFFFHFCLVDWPVTHSLSIVFFLAAKLYYCLKLVQILLDLCLRLRHLSQTPLLLKAGQLSLYITRYSFTKPDQVPMLATTLLDSMFRSSGKVKRLQIAVLLSFSGDREGISTHYL